MTKRSSLQSSSSSCKKLKSSYQTSENQTKFVPTNQGIKEFHFNEIVSRTDNSCLNQHVVFENKIPNFGAPHEIDQNASGQYRMVLRKEALELFGKIDHWHEQFNEDGKMDDTRLELWGSGGVGKTGLLFLATQYCFEKGWLVIYMPIAPSPCEIDLWCEDMLELLRTYYGKVQIDHKTVDEASKQHGSASQILTNVIQKLSTRSSKPVLIVSDQWNVLKRDGDMTNPFFAYFSNLEGVGNKSKAVFLCAVSSQTAPTLSKTAFRDVVQRGNVMVIYPYDEAAFMSHLALMQTLGKLKDLSVEESQMIRYETACIARLVTWIAMDENDRLDISGFSQKVVNYYSKRVETFMEGNTDQHSVFIAVSIYLNKVVKGPVDGRWIELGLLLHQGEEIYDAPCPSARLAVLHFVKSHRFDILDFLLEDVQCRSRALEFLVLQAFFEADRIRPVTRVIPLCSTSGLNIGVKAIRYQPDPIDQVNDIFNVERGTMLVCHDSHDSHAVVDFVFRTIENHLVFVQVSNSTYSKHSPLTEEIFTKTIQVKRKGDVELMTMFNFYRLCADMKEVAPGTRSHPNTTVVYLTPSQTKTKNIGGITILNSKEQWLGFVGKKYAERVFSTTD